MRLDLSHYFNNPTTQRQKQYDVVRAFVLEKQPVDVVAKKFGYKIGTVHSLLRDAKAGKIDFFPIIHKGPQQKQTSLDVKKKIVAYRQQGLSTINISLCLTEVGVNISTITVELVLKDAGFGKLKRRANKENDNSRFPLNRLLECQTEGVQPVCFCAIVT